MTVVKPVEAPQVKDMGSYTVPYVSYGTPNEEPSLILLHGISMPETHWGRLPEELAKLGHHVVAIGLPQYKYPSAAVNMSRSSANAAGAIQEFATGNISNGLSRVQRMMRRHAFLPTLGGYAEDQAPVIHELAGHRPYNLLGLSFGGALAQQHELDDRENINRLVLAGTLPAAAVPMVDIPDLKAIASVWSPRRSPAKSTAIYGGPIANDPELKEELSEIINRKINPIKHANQLVAASVSIGALITRRMMQRTLHGDAPETLVMAGTEDKIMPYKTVKLAALILGQTLETIPDDGHGFLISNPVEMAGIINKFLRSGKTDVNPKELSEN